MRGVTARELAGAQINANEGGRGEEWRGAVLSDKGSPITERPASLFRRLAAQAAPWGPRSLSALQSPPLSQRGWGVGQPPPPPAFCPGGVGEDGTDF